MKLIVLFRDEKEYIFTGLKEYSIEYGKYLKFYYLGNKDSFRYRNEEKENLNEGLFLLDAIAGYYIHK